jgi:phenylacetate-CoA ligase
MSSSFTSNVLAALATRDRLRCLDSQALAEHQVERLNRLLGTILPESRFYQQKLGGLRPQIRSLEELAELPFTFKDELVANDQHQAMVANLTYPVARYVRYHQTSGTRGRPLVVLDTAEDWQWWIETWQYVLDAAGVEPGDRCVLAFSFGPFIGFWSAFDAVRERGALAVPTGGMNTLARLELLRSVRATVLFCTPSYALHLAEVARENHIDVSDLSVRSIIVAGEPGGSVPSIRAQIEEFWGAKVIDHSGASEVGPWGFSDPAQRGLHVIESEFIAEFLSMQTGEPADEGELSELVLTSLGRFGSPVIRYRTGDLVRPTWNDDQLTRFVLLQGGVLGRTDDMLVIRGVNVFPTSIEQILRSFPEIVEYRLTAHKQGAMDRLLIEVEDRLSEPARVEQELRLRLGLRVEVREVPLGSLPRFEGKGSRFIDRRSEAVRDRE